MAARYKKEEYCLNTVNCWFPDQVEPDPNDRQEFKAYWKRERDRCVNGFTLADGQVYISGWMYFYTVYWIIELDAESINPVTGKKQSYKTKGTPKLRDVEFIVSNDLQQCEMLQKIYCLVGARGFGKSFMCSSFIGHAYTFFNDSECLLTAGNNPDIAKLAEKVNIGLSNLHPCFQKQRIKNNWKVEVRAGWKDKETGFDKGSASRILARNYDNGNNTMATNGTRPKRQIIDEAGKCENLVKCVLDSIPSWRNDYGFFSTPWITGTGGDMEVGQDLGILFNNPAAYNILEIDDNYENKGKIGRFIPVTLARNEYKHEITLSEYFNISHPDLDRVKVLISNEQECIDKFVNPNRARAAKSASTNDLVKEKAYYPLTPSECFLVISANDFPVEACKEQIDWIKLNDFKPMCVELYEGLDGKIKHKFTDKKPVRDFPVKNDSNKEGVIEVVEFPPDNTPYSLYVGGIDPYKISESEYSDSLGSVYIFKRMTTNLTEPFQYMPVAWYVGRPKSIQEWYNNVRLLLKWYNAQGMCENIDYGFIQYMIEKQETLYLAEGQSLLKEISPTSKSKGNYGLPPTTPMINHWINSLVAYTTEVYEKIRDKEGKVTENKLGVTRILDVMLLEEMIKFNKNSGNFDRIRSFGIALSYAKQLDALMAKISIDDEYKKTHKIVRSPFMTALNKGIGRIKSPFMGRK